MVISTIVIGSTIAVWLSIEGLFKQGVSDTYGETAAVLFLSTFKADMEKAENITASTAEVTFSFSENVDVHYTFNSSMVLRTIVENTDTFHVGIDDVQITLHKTLPSVVKTISFSVLLKNKVFPFFVTKDYANSRLFNFETVKNEP